MRWSCPCRGCTNAYRQGCDDVVKRILDLHRSVDLKYGYPECQHCETNYPCPTVRILNDTQ